MVSDTNSIDRNNVYVCDDRQSFDGGLQQLIKTNFCNLSKLVKIQTLRFCIFFNLEKINEKNR